MKSWNVCAVICEFNPMHTGHLNLIDKIKQINTYDTVLCLMSGNFVQRAEPAICDKYTRAKIALNNGADIVLELPTIFATASGERFASGAIKILNNLNIVNALAFGCETLNEELFYKIADIQINNSLNFKENLHQELNKGLSYPAALSFATAQELTNLGYNNNMSRIVLQNPNNLLAIEYNKALLSTNSVIKPLFFQRDGSGYNDDNIDDIFASASALRKSIEENNFTAISKFIPENSIDLILSEFKKHSVDRNVYNALLLNSLRNADLKMLAECSEGLEYKIKAAAEKYVNIDDVYFKCKTKRYTMSRLKRISLQALLSIKASDYNYSGFAKPRLLAIKNSHKRILNKIADKIIIQNSDYNSLSETEKIIADIDKRASSIYSLITKKEGNQFFENKIITI